MHFFSQKTVIKKTYNDSNDVIHIFHESLKSTDTLLQETWHFYRDSQNMMVHKSRHLKKSTIYLNI